MKFLNWNLFGSPFELVETYVYYDGPLTFAMRSIGIPDLYYIVNTVDEDEDSDVLIALATAVSSQRFSAARSGVIPFRSVFADAPKGTLFKISQTWEGEGYAAEATEILADTITARWLPEEDVRLSLPTQTVQSYEEAKIVTLSQAQNRTVFALEIEDPSARVTSFPAKSSGQLQIAIDGAVKALAKETFGDKNTPSVRDLGVSVLDLQAASFVMVLAIDTTALFESTDVTKSVFSDITSFVNSVATHDQAKVLDELKKHSAPSRTKLCEILKPLAARGSGLKITSVLADTSTPVSAKAAPEAVKFATTVIEKLTPEIGYISVKRGALTGLVIGTRRFVIFDDASGIVYKGEMSPEVTEKANGLSVGTSSYITATIRVETPYINDDTESHGVRFFLESIDEITDHD